MEIATAIREAVAKSERPQHEIAKAARLHFVNLSQFKAGARSLPLDALCRLAEAVGLEIKVARERR